MAAAMLSAAFIRFAGEDNSESDSTAARNRSTRRGDSKTARERLSEGEGPQGTRRYRRYLNRIVSDYDSATSGAETEPEDAPPVFENNRWTSHFTQVGEDFFSDATTEPVRVKRRAAGSKFRHRAIARHMDRMVHGDDTANNVDHNDDDSDDNDADERHERQAKRAARRQARSAATEKLAAAAGASTVPSSTPSRAEGEPPSDSDNNNNGGSRAMGDASETDTGAAIRLGYVMVGNAGEMKTAAAHRAVDDDDEGIVKASPWQRWLQVDKRCRHNLRQMAGNTFLSQLEAVLTPFKHGRMDTDIAMAVSPDTFTIVSVPLATVVPARESKGDDLQPGSARKTEEKKRTSTSSTSSAPVKRKAPTHTNDRSLLIEFNDGYGRFLAHGVAQWHGLVMQSETASGDRRYSRIHLPRQTRATTKPSRAAGASTPSSWRPHGLSLCSHIDLFSRVRAAVHAERAAAYAASRGVSANADLLDKDAALVAAQRRQRFLAAMAQRDADAAAEQNAAEERYAARHPERV